MGSSLQGAFGYNTREFPGCTAQGKTFRPTQKVPYESIIRRI